MRVCLLALLLAFPAWGQFGFSKTARHVQARLVLSHEVALPGETIVAAVELTHTPKWHTYWRSPGDSGAETRIFWEKSKDITPGEIQWPVPEKFEAEGLVTFVYHDRAVLLVPLTIASNATAGSRELTALVSWLECETACIPGSNLVTATLAIGKESKPGPEAALIEEAKRSLPGTKAPGTATARWDQPPGGTSRALIVAWNASVSTPDFFPINDANSTVAAKTQVLASEPGKTIIRTAVEKSGTTWPATIRGLLVEKKDGKVAGYEASLPIEGNELSTRATKDSKSIWGWLLYAFIGGLILNIMPCVLPVIALKILGFVAQSREHPRRVRTLGILYTFGVLVSFLVLAGIVIGVKAAGQKAGWGMQFSNPQFIVVLVVVVTLVALNLFGVFEITLGGGAMSAASEAASRHGSAGAFMNGVLATVLATPCTAPFLGAALGFAFAQPSIIIVLFFIVIGLGLALPYLILSWNPRWLKFLPKPGAWMERFKVGMGFPMLATAVWLFTLTISHYGKRVWWLGVFLVALSMAAWIFGTFVQRGTRNRSLAIVLMLILLLGGYFYAVEGQLEWRSPIAESASGDIVQEGRDGIRWQRWSPEAVAKARAEGHPVFVDFTADWCVTCQLNKKSSIEIPSVRAKLKEIGAVALLGDYTKFPPAITAELEKFQRAGVPLVLVYPRDSTKDAIVLPEVLTSGIVLKALDLAGK